MHFGNAQKSIGRRAAARGSRGFRPRHDALECRNLLTASTLPFTPLPASVGLGTLPETAPFALPPGFVQEVVQNHAMDADLQTSPDMNPLNETGPDAGRYLFNPSEAGSNAALMRTDLQTGDTVIIAQASYYDRLDGIRWTPWGTLLFDEESGNGDNPNVPQAKMGLVYEVLDPTGANPTVVPRPALGAKAHEGMVFDDAGNVYGIDENSLGGLFKFTPDTPGDLSSGQLYVLRLLDNNVATNPSKTGDAEWVALDRTAVQADARAAAAAVSNTPYGRPEDMEIRQVAGGPDVLYVAITSENRVLSVKLGDTPVVRTFVDQNTVNAASGNPLGGDFIEPDNLTIDRNGRIFIAEDPGTVTIGSDIWGAVDADDDGVAETAGRFASLSTLGAEPTGIYVNPFNPNEMFVNVQHPSSGNDAIIRIRSVASAEIVGGTLVVQGTMGDDTIRVATVGGTTGGDAVVKVGGTVLFRGPIGSFSGVNIDAKDGDDVVEVTRQVGANSIVRGGAGDDRITVGSGHNVLIGDDGDDVLFGGDHADILIGGRGRNKLWGRGGEDILIGGRTTLDQAGAANDAALAEILATWTDGSPFPAREAALHTRLRSLITFDADPDQLYGGTAVDWLFAGPADDIVDGYYRLG